MTSFFCCFVDQQTCILKFGSWTYDGFKVNLRHFEEVEGSPIVKMGIDLKEFYPSVEWDILEVPAERLVFLSLNLYLFYFIYK